jgi:hypothetical protein
MAAATKKKEKKKPYPWKACASSRHITHLKQSILETFNTYAYNTFGRIDANFSISIVKNKAF